MSILNGGCKQNKVCSICQICSDSVKKLTVAIWVIFDIRALTLRAERQSARLSKNINDCLTRSGTECFIALPIWQQ